MDKLFTHKELTTIQKVGSWPVSTSRELDILFPDRYKIADDLFKKLDTEKFLELNNINPADPASADKWYDDNVPEKSYALQHQGPCFGYDVDTMHGPVSWYDEQSEIKDYVQRRKLYVYDWTKEHTFGKMPEIDYFTKMHETFKPVLEHYLKECFGDQSDRFEKVLYKLMVVQYTVPLATDETRVSHRKHNTERFGDEHCDETLGGLHLGENFTEFQAKNTRSDTWESIPGLNNNSTLWMFGENAEQSGWAPTCHRMTPNDDPTQDQRYSIIFDLQARYEE